MEFRKRKDINKRLQMLREWYGDDFARTEIVAHCVKPTLIGETIEKVTKPLFGVEAQIKMQLDANWEEVIGSMLAKITKVSDLRGGELVLEVGHSAFLRELEGTTDLILRKVNQYIGKNCCKSVRLIPSTGR